MTTQAEIREWVANKVIEALQRGISPWHIPWSPCANTGFHRNVITRRRYSGVNSLLLQIAALERGFQSRWWGSFNQWASLGGQAKGGGSTIVVRNGDQHAGTAPRLREHIVLNADQVNGVEQFQAQPPTVELQPDFRRAERVIRATGADIREAEGTSAWYFYPPADYITIPSKFDFLVGKGGLQSWYDTAFHELFHWSEPRLGWDGGYTLNELRAEVGASFLSAIIGIPSYGPTNHHFNHVDSWVAALREDHRVIFLIARAAAVAASFILSFSRAEQPQDQAVPDVGLVAAVPKRTEPENRSDEP